MTQFEQGVPFKFVARIILADFTFFGKVFFKGLCEVNQKVMKKLKHLIKIVDLVTLPLSIVTLDESLL